MNPDRSATVQLADDPFLCLCAGVRRAARALTQRYDAALAPSGIGISQFGLLATIQVEEGIGLTDLAATLVMDRTTLSRNIGLLEREGLVEARPGKDRRKRSVHLTETGRAALRRALPYWREAQAQVMEELGEDGWHDSHARLVEIEGLARP